MSELAVYLDHHASTPLAPEARDAMMPWLDGRAGNPHAASSPAGRAAHAAIEEARAHVAALVSTRPENVVFTSGATEAVNIVLRSLVLPGSHLVTSAIEHACVGATAEALVQGGATVSMVGVDEFGLIEPAEVEDAMYGEVCTVSIMTVNNEVGTIQPIKEIADIVHDAGGILHSDAAQALGRIPIDLAALGLDAITLSAHKLYGPQGIGAIIATPDTMTRLHPIATGGGQERGVRPGTVPIALCVGFGAACALAAQRMAADACHARDLSEHFLHVLCSAISDVSINGDMNARVPQNLNLLIPGCDADDLVRRLSGVTISSGSACSDGAFGASPVLLAMGLEPAEAEASIRIGFGRGNTIKEVETAARQIAWVVEDIRAESTSKTTRRAI
ncbi:MAG: cysteine desulfurase [Rhodobacteraceae bacterium]|nr:cysteine desulfurase [Paracoccaceae bacterium]